MRDRRRRQIRDGGDHPVQEVPVVGHDDHGALVGGQEVLEPPERLQVEVVGRLVEEQQVRSQQQQAGQGRPHAPASRELGERAMNRARFEPEPVEDDLGFRLEPVPAHCLEAMLHLAVGVGEPGRGVGPRHAGGERLELRLEPPDLVEAREGLREHGAILAARDLLREIADGDPGVLVDAPGVGLLHAGQDAAQRGLARAVRAHEPDALAAPDAPRHAAQQLLAAVAFRHRVRD